MITNIIFALIPPAAAYIWTQIFLLAGGENFQDSFYYSMATISIIFIPVGLYHGRMTILVAGIFWLFVIWNVIYKPFAVLF